MPLRSYSPRLVSHVSLPTRSLILAAPSPVLTSGVAVLGVGGSESTRGIKPYNPISSTATVAAPYGQAQIEAARAAGGASGRILLPHAGSPYNSVQLDLTVGGQKWQLQQPNTVFNGVTRVLAQNCELEGGTLTSTVVLPRTGSGHNFTLRNVKRQGGTLGIANESRSGMAIRNCEFHGQTEEFGFTWYDNTLHANVDGQIWENCIGLRTVGGPMKSMVVCHDNGNRVRWIRDFRVTNCRFDGGIPTNTATNTGQGWFGIEVFGAVANASGVGSIVEYSDLRGGNVLLSIVESPFTWIHHNKLNLTLCHNGFENAGVWASPPQYQTGCIFEFNDVFGPAGTQRGWAVFHNSQARNNIIRNNKVTNVQWLLGGFPDAGGGYTIQNNCLINSGLIIPGAWGIPNIQSNNTPTACGF